jgi:acyl-CoA synthetase (AMP-forming)/AMP-acid ligase II
MIFKSPHAPVSIPDSTITEYVLRNATSLGDKPALIDGPTGRTYTYAQLPGLISRLAAGLAQQGVKKAEVFAIYSPNLPEVGLAFHAIASLGAATTMVPPPFTDEEIIKQLQDSGARYLLTVPQLIQNAQKVAKAAGITKVFVIGEAEDGIPFTSLLAEAPLANNTSINVREDFAALPYSSGTTGLPKGVMLTHRNLVAMLRLMEANQAFSRDDTMICVVPMYHLYGLHVVVNLGLSEGATIVTVPRYDLDQFLRVLEKYKVTVAPLVPPLVLTLSQAPQVDQHDLSSLRLIHCGAAMLAENIAQDCSQRLGCEIRYGYGMTEVSPLSHASLPDAESHRPGSVGFCLPNTECKIVDYNDVDGAELAANQEGEIWVRGPQVMKGYLGNPTATREMITPDGWLRTGDIGYCDVEGRLFVIDRLKELIKVDGRQVAPAELEAILFTYPTVADAAVVGSPDKKHGEVPKAFVVLKGDANEEEIMEYVAGRVARYKRVRLVEFISEIPKSPAGKTLRRMLRDRERRAVTSRQ